MVLTAEIQLCLVADDTHITANLLPLLDQQTRPRKVILLCEAGWRIRMERLVQVIRALDIKVEYYVLENLQQTEKVRSLLLQLLNKYQDQSIALNVSGGQRLLALLTYEQFRLAGQTVFHVNTQTRQLINLTAPAVTAYTLTGVVSLEQLLQARGFELQLQDTPVISAAHRAFAQELVANIRHYSQALANLNWLASGADAQLRSKPMESWHLASKTFIGLLDRLRGLGLALVHRQCLVFPGRAEHYFVNGGWLEDHVRVTLQRLAEQHPSIRAPASALNLGREECLTEVDVGFIANDQVHLIECRAKKLKKGNARSGAEAVHRADELYELGQTLAARTLLLSYCPLREVDLRRMKLMGIEVLQEKQLQDLGSDLQHWMMADHSRVSSG